MAVTSWYNIATWAAVGVLSSLMGLGNLDLGLTQTQDKPEPMPEDPPTTPSSNPNPSQQPIIIVVVVHDDGRVIYNSTQGSG